MATAAQAVPGSRASDSSVFGGRRSWRSRWAASAQCSGAVAAPTAGLHFTRELLAGLDVERVTLHVGLDTFRPVNADDLEDHEIHSERYQRPTAADIEARFAQREQRGKARYMELNPEMAALWKEHGITSLAQYYTSKIKYDPDFFAECATELEALLRERGFL